MSGTIDSLIYRALETRLEVESRLVERMLVLPGNLGARFYDWMDTDGYHCYGDLTAEVEHMTIASMPFGTKPES